jgi:hypothetical protein
MLGNRFDLINEYAILQGKTFDSVVVYYPDRDLTTWTFRGQIKNSVGNILANFFFPLIAYGTIIGENLTMLGTTIVPNLTAVQTAAIPANKKIEQISQIYQTRSYCHQELVKYYYEIEAENNGIVLSIISPSLVDVVAEVIN